MQILGPAKWFVEWLSVAKDVVTVIGAGVGIYVAHQGLSTWRRQLAGQAKFNLAKEILEATSIARDAGLSAWDLLEKCVTPDSSGDRINPQSLMAITWTHEMKQFNADASSKLACVASLAAQVETLYGKRAKETIDRSCKKLLVFTRIIGRCTTMLIDGREVDDGIVWLFADELEFAGGIQHRTFQGTRSEAAKYFAEIEAMAREHVA